MGLANGHEENCEEGGQKGRTEGCQKGGEESGKEGGEEGNSEEAEANAAANGHHRYQLGRDRSPTVAARQAPANLWASFRAARVSKRSPVHGPHAQTSGHPLPRAAQGSHFLVLPARDVPDARCFPGGA